MNLYFDQSLSIGYKSNSQKIRVMSEKWVYENMFCPCCGNSLCRFENNKPVADFYCDECNETFELKSKGKPLGRKITDGAYGTAINRINSNNNPDLFVLQYNNMFEVVNFLVVPKFFFTSNVIEKRKALGKNAKRAGWIGCNILLGNIPQQGKIFVIKNGESVDKSIVVNNYGKLEKLSIDNTDKRGWLLDVLNCINSIKKQQFDLNDVYFFENQLSIMHPNNHNVKAKIRQQLQILRDKGFIEFLGNGKYVKTNDYYSTL